MNPTATFDYLAKDRQYIWHPFTQMKDYAERDHILIERASGVKLYDAHGNEYYDTISSWWVNPHGHSHPAIATAIRQQLERFDHIQFSGFTHVPAIELAERLVKIAPTGLSKVFYSDNGSTAVEVALKMSFQYWQQTGKPNKTKFVFLQNSYHGDTLGAVSVGGVESYHALYKPLLFHALKIAPPIGMTGDVEAALAEADALFAERADEIAGLIVEPMIQAAGGMNMYPASYLAGLRQLCDKYDVHLIADEVAVGFGRTGTMFACEHAGISPDLLCLSKALTGGVLPLSVTMSTEAIFQAFYDDYERMRTFFHGHGFTANAIACAAALASLDIFENEHKIFHIHRLSSVLASELQRLSACPNVTNIRQLGMVVAFDLLPTHPAIERIGFRTYQESLKQGLVLRPLGDTIYYWLPYCVTEADIVEIVSRTLTVLHAVYETR